MVNSSVLGIAHAIGRQIAAAAVWQGNRCTWPQGNRAERMGGDVYEGTAGVAWFLANLAAISDDAALRRTALGAARSAMDWVRAGDTAKSSGLHNGPLGTLWAIAEVGDRLEVADLVEESIALVPIGFREPAVPVWSFDTVAGETGSLLALTCLVRHGVSASLVHRQGKELVEQVKSRCATLSLDARVDGEILPVGLAHGVSGAAWSLLELYALTSEEQYRQMAWLGFRYERAWFDRQLCTWRDPSTRHPLAITWCHGSVGIGLARLRAAELVPDPQIQAEVGAALAAVHTVVARVVGAAPTYTWEQSNCSICHGIMGLADLLLFAAHRLGVPEHAAAAERLIEYGVWRASQEGGWRSGTADYTLSYGLMLGLAGIGAVLLQYSVPDQPRPVGLLVYPTSAMKGGEQSVCSG